MIQIIILYKYVEETITHPDTISTLTQSIKIDYSKVQLNRNHHSIKLSKKILMGELQDESPRGWWRKCTDRHSNASATAGAKTNDQRNKNEPMSHINEEKLARFRTQTFISINIKNINL